MRYWTEEETVNLTRMWRKGKTGSQIAEEFGTTRSAVLARVRRLELARRRATPASEPRRKAARNPRITITDDVVANVEAILAAGHGWPEVVKATGLPRSTAQTRFAEQWEATRSARKTRKVLNTESGIRFRAAVREHIESFRVVADTRSITGRLCGDPLPGRSALDRMRGVGA